MQESLLRRGERYAVRAPLQNTGMEMHLSGDPSSSVLIRETHSWRNLTIAATIVGEEEHRVMSGSIACSHATVSALKGAFAMRGIS